MELPEQPTPHELRRQRIADALTTPEGRQALAEAMVQPVKLSMDLRYFYAGLLAATEPQDGVFGDAEEVVVETADILWERIHEGRYDLVERAADMLKIQFGNLMYSRLLNLVCQAELPTTDPVPEGWHRALINIRTLVDLKDAARLAPDDDTVLKLDPLDPNVLGRQWFYRKAALECARLVEPGLLFAFGRPDDVGRFWYDVQIEDASNDRVLSFKGTLRYRMALVEDPRIAIYRLETS
jgi:hypothetical protein